ncbi:MFS transporter [Heyndrickxia acidicola]|uniref:MFS transporter n=1 Tax=Heyndrickxia acidicola TaxID=209389 RepID=A0ABU6MDS4_9BACI|nr:MFS transporter [Heyndrickxia acidicola]MED1202584.1 MFS transporter [Heyndrickxia acidicola]
MNTQVLIKKQALIANKKFIFLMLVRTLTGLSFGIYLLGESWYVVNELNMKTYLGIILMLTSIPRLFLMFFGGILSDKYSKTNIMFVSLITRGLLVFTLVGLITTKNANIPVLLLYAFLFGNLDALFYPANSSIVSEVVDKEELTRANSFLQSTNLFSTMVSPILAGILLSIGSFTILFSVTGLLLLLSGISVFFINTSSPIHQKNEESVIENLKSGYRFVRKDTLLTSLMAIILIVNLFIVGPVNIALPLIVDERLGASALNLSFMQCSLFLGMLGATIVFSIINVRKKRGMIILSAMILSGFCILTLGLIHNLFQGLFSLAVYGVCISVSSLIIAIIQENTPSEKMGRVMGLTSTASLGLTPLSYGLTSLALFLKIPMSHILIACGCLVVIISSYIMWRINVVRVAD